MANSPLIVFFIFLSLSLSASAVTVSKDGKGDYISIGAAIAAAPRFSPTMYTIHVRAGIYLEYVSVPYDRTKIMLIGDGRHNTKIVGHRSRAGSDIPLYRSATVVIQGSGFVAQNLAFVNAGGPNAGQGVALENVGDKSVFYNCSIEGYQDTLWAASGRQFYRECDIYGSVDFIMGNAAAVFQSCNLYARYRKYLVFTAQSRESSYQKTGFVLHNCVFTMPPGDSSRRSAVARAILGRPWRAYSRVVILKSYIDSIIDQKGWGLMEDIPTNKLTYLEYGNRGPGAATHGRVRWPGVKAVVDKREVIQFTASQFINGDAWIPKTGVPYFGGL